MSAAIVSIVFCYFESICLIESDTSLLEIALAPLAILICWAITWGFVCLTFGLVCNTEDNLRGVKAGVSYLIAVIGGSLFPFIVIGG